MVLRWVKQTQPLLPDNQNFQTFRYARRSAGANFLRIGKLLHLGIASQWLHELSCLRRETPSSLSEKSATCTAAYTASRIRSPSVQYHFFGKAFGLKSIPELRPSERSSQNQSRLVGTVGYKLPNLDHFHQLPCPVAQVGLLDDLHHEILEPTVVTFGATLSVLEHLGLGMD